MICACVQVQNCISNEAIVLQWLVQTTMWDFKVENKRWAGALLDVNCCRSLQKPSWKSHNFELVKRFGHLATSGSLLSWCFFMPPGMLFIMKTLIQRWMVHCYKGLGLPFLRLWEIIIMLRVCACCPYLQSSLLVNSMILCISVTVCSCIWSGLNNFP